MLINIDGIRWKARNTIAQSFQTAELLELLAKIMDQTVKVYPRWTSREHGFLLNVFNVTVGSCLLIHYIFLEIQIFSFDVPVALEWHSSYQQLLLQSAFWKWRQKLMWYAEYFMEVRNDFHLKPN